MDKSCMHVISFMIENVLNLCNIVNFITFCAFSYCLGYTAAIKKKDQ